MIPTDAQAVPTWTDSLRAHGACDEAVHFAESFSTFAEAWHACDRGEWMLWWIGRTIARKQGPERRRLVKVACQCARLALPHVTKGETRPRRAIETAERWARGDDSVSLSDVRAAAAAADAAAAAAAAYAAYAAAADAAYAASDAAAYAAADADAADAGTRILRQCADLVRAEYPTPPETP